MRMLRASVPKAEVRVDQAKVIPERGGGAPLLPALLGIASGLVAAFFLDPELGKRRRVMVRDRLSGLGRRASRRAERATRYASGRVGGIGARLAHLRGDGEAPNDVTLTDRVGSEIFRDRDIPKGALNIDTVGGVVMIRGQVGSPELIEEIEEKARAVPGVKEVRNLMHLPGTPAPHID